MLEKTLCPKCGNEMELQHISCPNCGLASSKFSCWAKARLTEANKRKIRKFRISMTLGLAMTLGVMFVLVTGIHRQIESYGVHEILGLLLLVGIFLLLALLIIKAIMDSFQGDRRNG